MDIGLRLRLKGLMRRVPFWGLSRLHGGSGLLMSRTLRRYFVECNDRLRRHGPYSLPASFNVVESFLSYDSEYCLFDVRAEIEHLLSAAEYFDWYSANNMPKAPAILLDVLQEGVVYSYDMAGDASGFHLSRGESKLVIAGVSLVLHGHELSCMLVAGEDPPNPPDAEIAELSNANSAPFRGHEGVTPDPVLGVGDRYLDTFPGFARVILLTRLDLRAQTHDVRYLMLDYGNNYRVATDDDGALQGLSADALRACKQNALDNLAEYGELFSTLAALIYLPVAFVAESEHVHEETFVTELSCRKDEEAVRETIEELGEAECVLSRTIRCLATSGGQTCGSQKVLDPPALSFQSDGFWRPLEPGTVGRDKDNQPIMGKTWVARLDSWSAQGPEQLLLQRPQEPPAGPDPGIVYVVRSPSHDVDVYKIGLTRRSAEQRARELNSTAVPLPFGVLAQWEVGDCAAVESEVHRRLEAHRINPRREFFRASIRDIVGTVHQAITDLESQRQGSSS
jgi:T5orf172 domain